MSSEVPGQVFLLVPKDHCNDMQFYGIKRTGNHAIIAWILGHFENSIHYNNCIVTNSSNVLFRQQETPTTPVCNDFRKLISFEDSLNLNTANIEHIGKYLPPAKIRILILRDPYNTYASRIKLGQKMGHAYITTWVNTTIWKDVAKEFLGITNHLKATIKINYNLWFRSVAYRKTISENFGTFTDKNIDMVPRFGSGSSFDNLKYDNKASQMDVLNRWRCMTNDGTFRKIIKDEELSALSKNIFGDINKI